MKCPFCDGTGEVKRIVPVHLPKETYPQTNEDWLKGASTEELAEAITDLIKRIQNAEEVTLNTNKVAWIRWLQEKHI